METMVLSERETCGVFITSNFSYIDKSFPIEMRRYEKLSEKNRNSSFWEINDGVFKMHFVEENIKHAMCTDNIIPEHNYSKSFEVSQNAKK